jgi:glycosyltransferase involved in cell wall biosynthesis
MKRKNILFLISSLKFGGAEKQTVDLINNLDRSKFAITLCYFLKEQDIKNELHLEKMEAVICLDKKNKFDINALKKLIDIIANKRPEVVVSVNLYPSIYAHLICQLGRIKFKIIQIMHTTNMRSRFEFFLTRFFYTPLANRCESIVFVCRNQMEYWRERFGVNIRKSLYIYNGVDVDKFIDSYPAEAKSEMRKRYGIGEDDIVIAICAALRSEKRHVDLVEAARILVGEGLPVKILIVGDGAERSAIERHILYSGMMKHAIMTGYQKDVRPLIAIADIVVLVSTSETFSIAILEAMAMAKAIVAPDIGGIPEQVIVGRNGLLYPAGDVLKLAECLQIIAKGRADEMGIKSREMVCESFNHGQMVRKYDELLSEI